MTSRPRVAAPRAGADCAILCGMSKNAASSVASEGRIFLASPFVGRAERASVMRAFDSGYIAPCGPQLDEFERRLAALSGRKYAVALSSGTAAIDLVLEHLGVGEGWTVVAPTLSFIATVGPAWHRGAALRFVDCDATGNMDPRRLEEALAALDGKPGRVLVIGVDLFGSCCDYDALARLVRRHGATLVIDAAESVGSRYRGRGAGSAGVAAVYSFNGNKTVTTSGGGAIVTDSARLAAAALRQSMQGREPKSGYEHRAVGYNYRLSNVLAAIGLAQLDRLDELLRRKRRVADFYARHWKGGRIGPGEGSNCWLNVLLCRDVATRDGLLARFEEANVEAREAWRPLHLQPVFRGVPCAGGEVAEDFWRRGICVPSGAGLTARDLRRIANVLAGVRP